MKELYEKSIQAIIDLDRRPTKKEWNAIAKKYGFLNSVTLSVISKYSFSMLTFKLRQRNK